MSGRKVSITPFDWLQLVTFTVVPFLILSIFFVGNIPSVRAEPTVTIANLWVQTHVLAMGVGTLFIGVLIWVSIKFREPKSEED
ncbi:MAG: hypothetical protein ACE5KO_06820 [Candidatus Bathyarchaeia archaeon]